MDKKYQLMIKKSEIDNNKDNNKEYQLMINKNEIDKKKEKLKNCKKYYSD